MNTITQKTAKKTLDAPGREHVLTVRVTFDTFDTLKATARHRSTTVSELVRLHLSDKK